MCLQNSHSSGLDSGSKAKHDTRDGWTNAAISNGGVFAWEKQIFIAGIMYD